MKSDQNTIQINESEFTDYLLGFKREILKTINAAEMFWGKTKKGHSKDQVSEKKSWQRKKEENVEWVQSKVADKHKQLVIHVL